MFGQWRVELWSSDIKYINSLTFRFHYSSKRTFFDEYKFLHISWMSRWFRFLLLFLWKWPIINPEGESPEEAVDLLVVVLRQMPPSITVALKHCNTENEEGNKPCFNLHVCVCFLCGCLWFLEWHPVILFNSFQSEALGKEVKRRGLLGQTRRTY